MLLSDDAIRALSLPLDPSLVSTRQQGGATVPFLEGHTVTRTANEIFGYGGWRFELVREPWVLREGMTSKGTAYEVWAAWGKVIVGGEAFSDVGTGISYGNPESVEMAFKGAVTDAMKRCFRHFGDRFGLVLYDKHMSEADLRAAFEGGALQHPAPPAPPSTPPPPAEPEWKSAEAFVAEAPQEDPVDGVSAKKELIVMAAKDAGVGIKWIILALGGPEVQSAPESREWWSANSDKFLARWLDKNTEKDWADLIADAEGMKKAWEAMGNE